MKVALLAIAIALIGIGCGPATANDSSTTTRSGTKHNWIWVQAATALHGSEDTVTSTPAVHHDGVLHVANVCALTGAATCHAFATCQGGTRERQSFYVNDAGDITDLVHWCPSDAAAPPARAVLTAGRVLEAFRRLPLPESPLLIQPSGGKTLVNFDTIFYTTRAPFTRSVRLLGHRVSFAIRPARFRWVWGDGQEQVTTTPGRPFHAGVSVGHDITHRYLRRDRFEPHLDTTYTATYSVDGGPARPVGGTVTIAGTPQVLQTVTYTPLLVDD